MQIFQILQERQETNREGPTRRLWSCWSGSGPQVFGFQICCMCCTYKPRALFRHKETMYEVEKKATPTRKPALAETRSKTLLRIEKKQKTQTHTHKCAKIGTKTAKTMETNIFVNFMQGNPKIGYSHQSRWILCTMTIR